MSARHGLVLVALAGLAALSGGRGVRAQEPVVADTTPAPPPPGTGGWGAVDLAYHPFATAVSVTLAFPHGSAEDPEDATGSAWLLGQVVREIVLESLSPSARASTEVDVEVARSQSLFRVVTLPRHWREAWDALEFAVLSATPPPAAVERARSELEAVFAFEAGAPHRDFDEELYRLLSGPGSPWRRPPRGTATSVAEIDSGRLAAHRDRLYRKADGVVALVGAVPPADAARRVTGEDSLPPAGVVGPAFRPLESRSARPSVWSEGLRLVLDREVTSTWIAVAYPVDPATPQTALDMLVHHLEREFNPSPPDPGAFHVEVRLELLGSRDLLVVEAAVVPESAGQWEERILRAVEEVAAEELGPLYFDAYRRRFRASRLLRDAPPESESSRRALDLLHRGAVRRLPREIARLGPSDLRDAAARLAEPRTLVFGPDLGEGSSR